MRIHGQMFLFCGALVAVVIGAGCARPTVQELKNSFITSKAEVLMPKDSWGEFERASAARAGELKQNTYTSSGGARTITVQIPSAWSGDVPIWHPGASKLDQIRVAYFPSLGPETQWTKEREQVTPEELAHASKTERAYTLMVNNSALKATVLKIFTVDPRNPGEGFYLLECRVGYQNERVAFWEACKAALESATYH